jgi:hypothetical protein
VTYADVAGAIQNLIDAAIPLDGHFYALYAWRY